MRKLYRVVVSGWYLVDLEEDAVLHMRQAEIDLVHTFCETTPTCLFHGSVRLERAATADNDLER